MASNFAKLAGLIERGEKGQRMMLARKEDMEYEFSTEDANALARFQRIKKFRTLREKAQRTARAHRGSAAEPVLRAVEEFASLVEDVHRRRWKGHDLYEITAAIDE